MSTSIRGFLYTPDVNNAIKYLQTFYGQDDVGFEITVKGKPKSFTFDKPIVTVYFDKLPYYFLDFNKGAFKCLDGDGVSFYLSYWEQVALYTYLKGYPNVPPTWKEAERKIRARRGDPLKAFREAQKRHFTMQVSFSE